MPDDKNILNATELAEYLRISRAKAYELLHSESFPMLHICGRLLVTRENLLTWLEKNTNKMA